jgi:hypothetical protein
MLIRFWAAKVRQRGEKNDGNLGGFSTGFGAARLPTAAHKGPNNGNNKLRGTGETHLLK